MQFIRYRRCYVALVLLCASLALSLLSICNYSVFKVISFGWGMAIVASAQHGFTRIVAANFPANDAKSVLTKFFYAEIYKWCFIIGLFVVGLGIIKLDGSMLLQGFVTMQIISMLFITLQRII